MRVRSLNAFVCITILIGAAATSAQAASTGGAPAAPTTSAPATPTATTPALKLSPVTAKSPKLTYTGPVYQQLATGEVVPYVPLTATKASATGGATAGTVAPGKPELLVPGSRARYIAGLAAAPMSAPAVVQEIVWAGNQLIGLPYIYGGGHASFISPGYDCSGTVSYALHGGDLLTQPEDSSEFMHWGSHGLGRWVTIFSNPGHAYMTVAGLRLDTSAADDPSNQQGPRWRPLRSANRGYTVRHPLGL